MDTIIRESIDFSKTPEFNPDNLQAKVTKASIDRENHVLSMTMELNFVVSEETAERIRTNIKRSMPGIRDVDLAIEYKTVLGTEVPAPVKKKVRAEAGGGGKTPQTPRVSAGQRKHHHGQRHQQRMHAPG